MWISFYRAVVFYLALIVVVRLMGKRQLGQMEPSEFVVTMLIANLATIPMEDITLPLHHGLSPIFTVLAIELLFSVAELRSVFFRKLLCGKPVILIENGKILQKNLKKTRVTLDELSCHLRQKDVLTVETVQYAILETNGTLSVFPFPEHLPADAATAGVTPPKQSLPVTIVADGRLYMDNLRLSGMDSAWLEAALKKRKTTLKETFLLTVDSAGTVYWIPREKK
jgi:uncharacterized membrane protein YcaP (DUF421 family)